MSTFNPKQDLFYSMLNLLHASGFAVYYRGVRMISIGIACGLRKDGAWVYFVDTVFEDFNIQSKNDIEVEITLHEMLKSVDN